MLRLIQFLKLTFLDILAKSSLFLSNSSLFKLNYRFFTSFLLTFPFLSLFTTTQLYSQNHSIETLLNRWIEDYIENQENNNFEFWEIQLNLQKRIENPIHLNSLTRQDLTELLIFNDAEIDAILSHRDSYSDFVDIHEIQAIRGLSLEKAKLLSLFVYLNDKRFSYEVESTGNNNVWIKWKTDIETRQGFKDKGTGSTYVGDKNYFFLRLNNHITESWKYGFTLEKDPGENFNNSNVGFDYTSGYIQKTKVSQSIETIILGDFSARFGQGLIVGNSFNLGKSISSINTNIGGRSIRPYTSTIENLMWRGIATQVKLKDNIGIIGFVSHKPIDANLDINQNDEKVVTSLQNSGLHRTQSEINDRDSNQETTIATRISYDNDHSSLAFNSSFTRYKIPILRSNQAYNKFRFSGNQFANFSIDYKHYDKSFTIFGELAMSSNASISHTHTVMSSLDRQLDISLNYRSFSPSFYSISENSFSESRLTQNEEGFYTGIEYRPTQNWKINSYIDIWHHPWLKFRVDGPSYGIEYALRIEFRKKRKSSLYAQYRYESKEENSSQPSISDYLVNKNINRLRVQYTYQLNTAIKLRTRTEYSHYIKEKEQSNGWLLFQDVIYSPLESVIALRGRLSYFSIDDFDSRIYAYENDISFEYSVPFFSGSGWRYYLVGKYKFNRKISGEFRISQTRYTDGRTSISSGSAEILGNTYTQAKLQIRYKIK